MILYNMVIIYWPYRKYMYFSVIVRECEQTSRVRVRTE